MTGSNKAQATGMLGVYLTAAELTDRGYIVSPTSRSAMGADLLVVDDRCKTAWSVQVKAQRQAANYWLVGEKARHLASSTHIYVFVNLKGDQRPDYLVVPSAIVAGKMYESRSKTGSLFHCFDKASGKNFIKGQGWSDERQEGWELFSDYPTGFNPLPPPSHVKALCSFLPLLEELVPDDIIRWSGGNADENGIITMPYAVTCSTVSAFLEVLYALGFVMKFDWTEWQEEARKYFDQVNLLDQANLETCVRLLTTHARMDRFSEGHLAEMISSGHILRILRRLSKFQDEASSII